MLDKYNEIWDKIKEALSIKFHSRPVYDEKYIKIKVREFNCLLTLSESKDLFVILLTLSKSKKLFLILLILRKPKKINSHFF